MKKVLILIGKDCLLGIAIIVSLAVFQKALIVTEIWNTPVEEKFDNAPDSPDPTGKQGSLQRMLDGVAKTLRLVFFRPPSYYRNIEDNSNLNEYLKLMHFWISAAMMLVIGVKSVIRIWLLNH